MQSNNDIPTSSRTFSRAHPSQLAKPCTADYNAPINSECGGSRPIPFHVPTKVPGAVTRRICPRCWSSIWAI